MNAHFYLVVKNTATVNTAGLIAGDVVAVDIRTGDGTLLRQIGTAPPTGVRARLVSEGALQLLQPALVPPEQERER